MYVYTCTVPQLHARSGLGACGMPDRPDAEMQLVWRGGGGSHAAMPRVLGPQARIAADVP